MRAAGYERTGPAREVLQLLELPDPTPDAGEVRVRMHSSGVNLNALLRADKLHNIAARLPLEHIVDAHEMVESGRAVGNVVVSLR